MREADRRLAAFIEYVVRPLTEDWRRILEELRALNVGITTKDVKTVTGILMVWHLLGEIVRAVCYIGVTWVICQAIVSLS